MQFPFKTYDALAAGLLTALFSLGLEGLRTLEHAALAPWTAPLYGAVSATLALGAIALWRKLSRP
jgi:hypothetical protein